LEFEIGVDMKKRLAYLVVATLALCCEMRALECNNIAALQHNQLVDYLKNEARTADPQCVTNAIYRLGDTKSKRSEAVAVLVKLLDFKRPPTAPEKLHIHTNHDWYPAVDALYQMGESAVQPIIDRLAKSDEDSIVRKNGVRALFFLYSSKLPTAVSLLMRASRAAENQAEAIALESAAKDELQYCTRVNGKAVCEAALNPE
jgi:HEAT repeat protein